jgi:hypothetical protein
MPCQGNGVSYQRHKNFINSLNGLVHLLTLLTKHRENWCCSRVKKDVESKTQLDSNMLYITNNPLFSCSRELKINSYRRKPQTGSGSFFIQETHTWMWRKWFFECLCTYSLSMDPNQQQQQPHEKDTRGGYLIMPNQGNSISYQSNST